MSPGEVSEGIGWAPLVSVGVTIAVSLLGYGASNQRNKQTADDLDELKRDHGQQIKDAKWSADQVASNLASYKEAAREKFVIAEDLKKVEASLSSQITSATGTMNAKVEELRQEFGRRGIEHTIKNAIAADMAQAHLAKKQETAK